MERIEDKIRGYLAKNLDIISDELELIKEEYYLKNSYGATGRIDILAKDKDNNYVVIEIKRSDQAARQALHEIAKYTALLRQELFVKDSEIRLIIVSTIWHELLVPFSQVLQYSNQYIEGYKITLDNNNNPIEAEKIIPILITNEREFSRHQSSFLYEDSSKLNENKCNLEKYASKSGFSDYIILEIHAEGNIPYPVALYFAYQRMNETFYLDILKNIDKKSENEASYYEELYEFKMHPDTTEDEYMNFLEDMVCIDIINNMNCDSYEIGYPEKISQSLSKNWKIDHIYRYGIFEKDKRMTNNDLVGELCGFNGIGLYYYYNQCLSKYESKVSNIQKDVKQCLFSNENWEEEIDVIFEKLKNEQKEFRINISIFNPVDIFGVIASISLYNIKDSIPYYQIMIEYLDENIIEIYRGIIEWENKEITFNQIFKKYFYGDKFNYFLAKQDNSIYKINSKLMMDMGLKYSTELLKIENGQKTLYDLEFKRKGIELKKYKDKKYFIDYLLSKHEFIEEVVKLYKNNVVRV